MEQQLDNEFLGSIGKMMAVSLEAHKKTSASIDDIYARLSAPDGYTHPNKGNNRFENRSGYRTAGQRLADVGEEMQKSLGQTGRFVFQAGRLFADSEHKSTVTSSDVGFGVAGVVDPQRVNPIVVGARKKLVLRDLLVSRPCTSGIIDFPRESSFTSGASPQTEGSAKGESTFALTIASVRPSTLAHFVTVSNQVLDDVQGIRQYIDTTMLHFLKLKEEQEFLVGDGLANHQLGLVSAAISYIGSFAQGSDTVLDKIAHYVTEAAVIDEDVNFFVMHPQDWSRCLLVKTDVSGANTGSYLLSSPDNPGGAIVAHHIWGIPVLLSRNIPSGHLLAGDSSKCIIFDRTDSIIDLSRSHASNWTSNLSTILAEERTAIAILRTTSFRYGSI